MRDIINNLREMGDPISLLIYKDGKEFAPPGARTKPYGKRGDCFRDALLLAMEDPTLTYVEGYGFLQTIPIHHAWCVDATGKVIDRVWSPKGVTGYFGLEIPTLVARDTVVSRGTWGVFVTNLGMTLTNLSRLINE